MTNKPRAAKKRPSVRRRAKVLGIGPDNRKIYTKDLDARAGHRSATKSRKAGPYVGRELHLGVAVPALVNTDTTSWVKFGPDVPHVIVTAALVPAGSHRGDAVLPLLEARHREGLCADVVTDAGYSLLTERFVLPLQAAGIPLTLRPKSHQVGEGARIGSARVFDGQLFSEHVPDDLVDLRLPAENASPEERAASMLDFERRAAYRYTRHKAPGRDGTTRWMGPLRSGRVRSRALPKTMRSSRKGPLDLTNDRQVEEPVLLLGAGQLPLQQPTIVGTRAHTEAYGRQNQAESANSFLHRGGFINIDKGYVRMSDSGRIHGLVAHGLAGYNRWATRQFRRIHRLLPEDDPEALPAEPVKRKPRKTRLPRYEDIGIVNNGPPHEA